MTDKAAYESSSLSGEYLGSLGLFGIAVDGPTAPCGLEGVALTVTGGVVADTSPAVSGTLEESISLLNSSSNFGKVSITCRFQGQATGCTGCT